MRRLEDRCIICGTIIPEGRMVCPTCEKRIGKENSNNVNKLKLKIIWAIKNRKYKKDVDQHE